MPSTTGILTLSVHEALTFDGTEIALHPDLFAAPAASLATTPSASNPVVAGTSASTAAGGGESASAVAVAAAAAAQVLLSPGSMATAGSVIHTPGKTKRAVAKQKGTSKKAISSANRAEIDVGDMIKIRVWMPKPGHHKGGKRGHHGYRSPPNKPLASIRTPGTAVAAPGQISTIGRGASMASTSYGSVSPVPVLAEASSNAISSLNSTPNISPTEPIKPLVTADDSPSTVPSAATTEEGTQGIRHMPMRRDGSSRAAVEAADIITPTLEGDNLPQPQQLQPGLGSRRTSFVSESANSESSDGTSPSTNPQDGAVAGDAAWARQSAASSLSSTSNVAAAISSIPAPGQNSSATLPPLPPARVRSRANTGDSNSAGGLSGGSGSQQFAPAAIETGNRIRINTLPTTLEKSENAELQSSPRSLGERQSTSPGKVAVQTDSSIPFLSGNVGTGPGHVRDISKLSVGSDFGDSGARHSREASVISSVIGEHLVGPSFIDEGDNQAKDGKKDGDLGIPGSGRIARTLMHPFSHRRMYSSDDSEQTADALGRIAETHDLRTSFVITVTEKTLTSIKSSARTQISILRQVADLYNLSNYDQVTVTKIYESNEAEVLDEISADFVLVTFKDQFISRGEMHHFQKSLIGRWLYEGVRLDSSADGIRANATEIRHGDRQALSGIVTEETKITFRSRSTRIIWLVQISTEMWDYASPYEANIGNREGGDEGRTCEIYFDKFVSFMHRLFKKWEQLDVTHSLTVVFFSRTYWRNKPDSKMPRSREGMSGVAFDSENDGRVYEDHYRMVIQNETRTNWESLVHKIKKAFVSYPAELGWNVDPNMGRVPSTAAQGNLLEAINITLNLLQFHYMDRDLHRTGNSVVVVSAGCGVFEVDKGLASITKQRMMDNGIGSDMLSLCLPPLHVAPFFLYKEIATTGQTGHKGFDDWKTYFEIPHWMHLSYFNYDDESSSPPRTGDGHSLHDSSLFPNYSMLSGIQTSANGFIVRGPRKVDPECPSEKVSRRPMFDTQLSNHPQAAERSHSQRQQRHLITNRDFEDILEACRPRNRGESLLVVPSALRLMISDQSTSSTEKEDNSEPVQDQSMEKVDPHRSVRKASELGTLREWGTVDFSKKEPYPVSSGGSSLPSHDNDIAASPFTTRLERHASGSDTSSPSSSFASHYSYILGRSAEQSSDHLTAFALSRGINSHGKGPGMQIQPSSDMNLPLLAIDAEETTTTFGNYEKSSEGSLSSIDNIEHNFSHSAASMMKLMSTYDSAVFAAPTPKAHQNRSDPVTTGVVQVPLILGARETTNLRPNWGALSPRKSDHSSRLTGKPQQSMGGIGAALTQFDGVPLSKHASMNRMDRFKSLTPSSFAGPSSMGPFDDVSKDLSPSLLNAIGMPLGSVDESLPPPSFVARALRTMPRGSRPLLEKGTHISIAPSSYYGAADTSRGGRKLPLSIAAPTPKGGPNLKEPNSDRQREVTIAGSPSSPSKTLRHQQQQQQHHQQYPYKHGTKQKGKSKSKHRSHHGGGNKPLATTVPLSQPTRRKAWVLNPFRQQDEEEVLAKRTHNRRRWSHVFPPGEIEFKRHAGPNWKSLCQPAILPTTIDYHPTPTELNDPSKFQFGHYSVALDDMDRTYYQSHSDLLREMVKQRLIQDFQIVPRSVIQHSAFVGEKERKSMSHLFFFLAKFDCYLTIFLTTFCSSLAFFSTVKQKPGGDIASFPSSGGRTLVGKRPQPHNMESSMSSEETFTLSMGHRLTILSYNPHSDSIEVVRYYSRFATNDPANTQLYHYNLWCPTLQRYTRVSQRFSKYNDEYLWNKVDNLICGDAEQKLFETSRYRRIMFRIIPEHESDPGKEAEYVKKFQRLLDYISRQMLKQNDPKEMDIKIIGSTDMEDDDAGTSGNRRRGAFDPFKYYRMALRKGSSETYQWMEIVMESTFDTRNTYKIMLHWLVANAIQVDAQSQLLQRRCAQYGLRLVPFPQDSIASGVQLHPFLAPILIPVRDKETTNVVEESLPSLGFISDGTIMMDYNEIEEDGGFSDYVFPVSRFGRRLKFPANQYVHNTGTLFVRVLRDGNGCSVVIAYENRRYTSGDDSLMKTTREVFVQLHEHITSLLKGD